LCGLQRRQRHQLLQFAEHGVVDQPARHGAAMHHAVADRAATDSGRTFRAAEHHADAARMSRGAPVSPAPSGGRRRAASPPAARARIGGRGDVPVRSEAPVRSEVHLEARPARQALDLPAQPLAQRPPVLLEQRELQRRGTSVQDQQVCAHP
jgi:hypothetical protein